MFVHTYRKEAVYWTEPGFLELMISISDWYELKNVGFFVSFPLEILYFFNISEKLLRSDVQKHGWEAL